MKLTSARGLQPVGFVGIVAGHCVLMGIQEYTNPTADGIESVLSADKSDQKNLLKKVQQEENWVSINLLLKLKQELELVLLSLGLLILSNSSSYFLQKGNTLKMNMGTHMI
jgi:hypothetical protein